MDFFLKRKKLSFIVYGLFLSIVTLSLWIIFREDSVSIERGRVFKGKFIENILLDGRVKSRNKVTITAFANGDIDEILVKKGDIVRKNQRFTTLHWDIHKVVGSPFDGVVVAVYRTSAGPVSRGEPLLDVVDLRKLEIVAEALTTEALRMSVGNDVEIRGLGEEKTFLGKVLQVSRAGFVKTSALGVEEERTEVRIAMEDVSEDLLKKIGEDYFVEVSIIIFEKNDGLIVPLGALFKVENNWAVYKIVNNRAKLQKIEIQRKNDREVLLKSGLSEGEEVILFPSDVIKEGLKVE